MRRKTKPSWTRHATEKGPEHQDRRQERDKDTQLQILDNETAAEEACVAKLEQEAEETFLKEKDQQQD